MSALTAELRPHPQSPLDAIRRFDVEVRQGSWPRELRVRYRIEGDMKRLRLPPPDSGFARRTDGLWQHTCFEAFLRPDSSESYHEFNFSPSGDWAAWRFDARRTGRSLPTMPAPPSRFMRHSLHCEMTVDIPVEALPELAGAAAVNLGIAAVIESLDGELSYWALSHRGMKPDFHDPASFELQVTPR